VRLLEPYLIGGRCDVVLRVSGLGLGMDLLHHGHGRQSMDYGDGMPPHHLMPPPAFRPEGPCQPAGGSKGGPAGAPGPYGAMEAAPGRYPHSTAYESVPLYDYEQYCPGPGSGPYPPAHPHPHPHSHQHQHQHVHSQTHGQVPRDPYPYPHSPPNPRSAPEGGVPSGFWLGDGPPSASASSATGHNAPANGEEPMMNGRKRKEEVNGGRHMEDEEDEDQDDYYQGELDEEEDEEGDDESMGRHAMGGRPGAQPREKGEGEAEAEAPGAADDGDDAGLLMGLVDSIHRSGSHQDLVDFVIDVNQKTAAMQKEKHHKQHHIVL
jgi:hypothetical protein